MEGPGAATGRRLLVLGAGPAQLGLLAAARERGLFVIALDRDPAAPGFRYADRRAIISTEDEQGIERLASAERVEGIIAPGIDWPVAIAARVAHKMGLAHPLSPAAAALAPSRSSGSVSSSPRRAFRSRAGSSCARPRKACPCLPSSRRRTARGRRA